MNFLCFASLSINDSKRQTQFLWPALGSIGSDFYVRLCIDLEGVGCVREERILIVVLPDSSSLLGSLQTKPVTGHVPTCPGYLKEVVNFGKHLGQVSK